MTPSHRTDSSDLLAHAIREEGQTAEILLTVKEFAERQRLHVQTVYTAIRYGRLKYRVERSTTGKRAAIRIAVPRFHVEA